MRIAWALALLYLLPGFGVAALFSGRTRWNPVVWLLASLLVTPVVLSNVGVLGGGTHDALWSAAQIVGVYAAAFVIARLVWRCGGELELPPVESRSPAARAVALSLALAFVVCVALARTSLLAGEAPGVPDDREHIAQVTAVAATGVPPRHYHFPQLPLSYYFYNAVLPGLLARLAYPDLGVAQALAVHVFIETVALALTTYALAFRLCAKPWPAVALVWFLTFGGGFDFWVALATDNLHRPHLEPWPQWLHWFPQALQLSLPITLAVWVPHHFVAAYGVLIGAALIGLVRGDLRTRIALLGLVFAFMAGCSVFATIGAGGGVALWTLGARRIDTAWNRRDRITAVLIGAVSSLALLGVYAGKDSLLGVTYGTAAVSQLASWDVFKEFALTKLVELPRFALFLLIDGGITVPLFVFWLWLERRGILDDPQRTWIAAIGVAFVPVIHLVGSPRSNDFAMRGIVPAQFAWAVGSAWALGADMAVALRCVIATVAVVGGLAALPSTAFEVYRHVERDRAAREPAEFVRWLNTRTALDAPVVLLSGTDAAGRGIYSLERLRLPNPAWLDALGANVRMSLQPDEVKQLSEAGWDVGDPTAVCGTLAAIAAITSCHVYLLDRAPPQSARMSGQPLRPEFGKPVYRDLGHVIYHVDCCARG